MKIATAAYPLDWLESWNHYEDKLSKWVSDAAGNGAASFWATGVSCAAVFSGVAFIAG